MTSYWIIIVLGSCVFGLLYWLTREKKAEGGMEARSAILQANLQKVADANALQAKIDAMPDSIIADELRKRTRGFLSGSSSDKPD